MHLMLPTGKYYQNMICVEEDISYVNVLTKLDKNQGQALTHPAQKSVTCYLVLKHKMNCAV